MGGKVAEQAAAGGLVRRKIAIDEENASHPRTTYFILFEM